MILKNGTSPESAILKFVGENTAPYYACRDGVVVKPGNENKCALSTFMQNLVDGALTEPLAGSDAQATALDFAIHMQYVNAITRGTQMIKMDLRIFDEPTSVGQMSVCEHPCNDFDALEPHFTATVCDDADFVLSGFESIMSAVGNLLSLNDLYLTLQIRLNNIFAFRMSVDYITLTIKYDDPDGVDTWWLPSYAAGYELMLLDAVGITVSPTYELEPGERKFSEEQTINAGDITGELFARLYDEAASKGRLCIHIFLSLDILIGDNAGRDEFAVTIPLEIKHLSTLGNTDCVNTGECVPTLTEAVDVTSFSSTNWNLVGDASIKSGTLYINDYPTCGNIFGTCTGSTRGAAWYVLS